MIIPGLAPRVGSGALVPGSLRRAWLLGQPLGGVVRTPSASQSSLTPDTASVVTANGSSTIAYTGVLRDDSGNEMAGVTGVTVEAVEWFPLSRILADSFVSVSSPFIASDGVEEVTISVQLGGYRNGEWYPLVGVAAADIGLAEDAANTTIAALSGVTDENGIIQTTMTTTEPATVITISATLFGDALTDTATCESDGEAVEPDPGDPFFEDDFTGPAKTNANGFQWQNGASLTAAAATIGADDCLTFTFGPDDPGEDTNVEQRFNLGRNVTELWIQYRLYVPANFAHRNDTGPDNNKFLRVWGDAYTARNKVGFSTVFNSSYAENSALRFEYCETGETSLDTNGSPAAEYVPTAALGTWRQVRIHLKHVSADSAADGEAHVWFDGVQVYALTNVDQRYVEGQAYWNAGYFLGAANSGYLDETVFGIDDVKFYDTDPGWA